jgi:hypothetical protein
LQVTGGVGERQSNAGCEVLNAALTLAQVFQQLQSVRMAECLRNFGEAG